MERHTKSYLRLIKPGITLSNTIAAAAGYFLVSSSHGFAFTTFLAVVVGVALIIASACVVNNIIDRDFDARMKRTKDRDVAVGKISVGSAGAFAAVLGVIGFGSLILWTNQLTVALGVVAYVWYVVIYGVAKRTTPLSTIIGAVPGALPPVAGYTALSGQLDAVAWVLFGLMFVWQLPHFYAIAMFRADDYGRVKLPIWSVRYGMKSTKAQIFFWVVIYALLSPLLTLLHVAGLFCLVILFGTGLYWLYVGAKTYRMSDDVAWARHMFGVSLIVLLAMCGGIAVGGYLP